MSHFGELMMADIQRFLCVVTFQYQHIGYDTPNLRHLATVKIVQALQNKSALPPKMAYHLQ